MLFEIVVVFDEKLMPQRKVAASGDIPLPFELLGFFKQERIYIFDSI